MRSLWLMPAIGVLMVLFGAYVAGGWSVTCARSRLMPAISEAPDEARPALIAECRVESRRWLARKVTTERTYLRVTGVDTIVQSRTETTRDANGRSRTYQASYWSLRLLSGESEITQISGTQDQVHDASARLTTWFTSGGAEPIRADFSHWGLALGAGGFGFVWIVVSAGIFRSMRKDPSAWRSGRRRRAKRQPEPL